MDAITICRVTTILMIFKIFPALKINVRPVGNAAQDIHNRAIKSATDWFEFFTLAFILTKDRIEKKRPSASIEAPKKKQ